MYNTLTEKNRDKTVVRGAKFENKNLMCRKSTYVVPTARVVCVICSVILSVIYFQSTLSLVVSLSTAVPTGYAGECRLSMR